MNSHVVELLDEPCDVDETLATAVNAGQLPLLFHAAQGVFWQDASGSNLPNRHHFRYNFIHSDVLLSLDIAHQM